MSEPLLDGGGTSVRLLVAADSMTLLELELESGAGAGWHTHTREDETIAVVSGALVVDDGERRELGPGQAVFLHRGVPHTFSNEADTPARAHVFCAPGGLERFFRDVAAAASDTDVASAGERAGIVFG